MAAREKRDREDQMEEIDSNGDTPMGCCFFCMAFISIILIICTFPFSLFFCIKIVQEYERAVIFRLGRVLSGRAKGPGLFFILPCTDQYKKVDLRTQTIDIPPQEVLTKDSVSARVDAVVYYRISNPTFSVMKVENVTLSTFLLAQTTLRNMLGTRSLSEILAKREEIGQQMQEILDEGTDPWGVKVELVEMKDVRLPVQLQRSMAAEAEATRDAKAKIIAAEGERNASRALKEASEIINQAPAALQLRYLQSLNTIASHNNHTVIFPLPLSIISKFISKSGQ